MVLEESSQKTRSLGPKCVRTTGHGSFKDESSSLVRSSVDSQRGYRSLRYTSQTFFVVGAQSGSRYG